MEKLTTAQTRALQKLSDIPTTAHDINEQNSVLDNLVYKGFAKKLGGGLGSMFSPATTFKYRLL